MVTGDVERQVKTMSTRSMAKERSSDATAAMLESEAAASGASAEQRLTRVEWQCAEVHQSMMRELAGQKQTNERLERDLPASRESGAFAKHELAEEKVTTQTLALRCEKMKSCAASLAPDEEMGDCKPQSYGAQACGASARLHSNKTGGRNLPRPSR